MAEEFIKLNKNWVAGKLPDRPKDANKGTFGKVLVIGGSENFPGAAYLACAASYRVGAGLVSLASVSSVCNYVVKKLPEVTLIPIPDKEGVISDLAMDRLYEKLSSYDEEGVILIGPGLSVGKPTAKFVHEVFKLYDFPKLVIDGDGLNILSHIKNWWELLDERGTKALLTPHPKEFSRLTGLSVEKIQTNRANLAKKFAADIWGQTVILKGANTVIASPSGEVAISPFANPALATAGTGDILAGCIAGFLAQGLSYFDAACVAVYIHGLAGEIIKEKLGEAGTLASDLLPILPKAIRQLSGYST